MSLTLAIIVGIAMGIVFGFALEKSRVFEPGIIVGQMQMRNFIMLKIFLTAVATYLHFLVGGFWALSFLQAALATATPSATVPAWPTTELIGKIGGTGRSNGPHLHWELWVNGIQVNPLDWLETSYP